MVFCSSCGKTVPPAARFCASCGNPSSEPGSEAKAVPTRVSSRDMHSVAASPTAAAVSRAKSIPATAAVSNVSIGDDDDEDEEEEDEPEVKSNAARPLPKNKWDSSHDKIIDGLKVVYQSKVKPLEEAYRFDHFYSPLLSDSDFEAKPFVLLLGQYSVGKTSFIKFLLERDFPGSRIGPEPTTDRFVAVMHGPDERTIPGNAVAVQGDMPFRALQRYGMAFLNKFEAALCPAPILQKITFIDTPGVLSGEKQRLGRTYDFPEVIEWFAERADRILLLFDAHKLDISDEFKRVIEILRGHDDKIRVVLNKADSISYQALMRVYGALMWSLGKVIKTPEVLRVYLGSFWDHEYLNKENKALFEAEQNDLLADLRSLPRNSAVRKVNELVKRGRCAKVHALIVDYMRSQFGWFGKEADQERMLETLPEIFKVVQQTHNLPVGDFPSPARFKELISKFKIWEFPEIKPKWTKSLDDVLTSDIPRLLQLVPGYDSAEDSQGSVLNPFETDNDVIGQGWVITQGDKTRFDNIFHGLNLDGEKVKGIDARAIFVKSGLTQLQLKQIWNLADFTKRGMLDAEEFAVAMHLIEAVQEGRLPSVPERLTIAQIPPSKRHLIPHALHE